MKKYFYILFFFTISSCNSVFYYPDRKEHFSLAHNNIDHKNWFIESNDKKKINIWMIPAKGHAKGTIVQFHGNAENMSSHFVSLYWVTYNGYNLVTFDYRGYGKSDGTPDMFGFRKDSTKVLKFVNYLDKNILGQKLIYHGQSIGGVILMETVAGLPQELHPDAIVLEGTFLSYRNIAFEQLKKTWYTSLLIPVAFFFVSDSGAPVEVIKKLPNLPYLVIHGEADSIVPLKFGKEIFSKLSNPKEFMLVPNGLHLGSFNQPENKIKYLEFLEKL